MKKIFLAVACILLLAACGKKEEPVTVNSLELSDDGILTAWSVAAFDKEYLDLADFRKEAKAAVSTYNEKAGEERISLKDISEAEGTVTVRITYQSFSDYQAFNSVLLNQGSLAELARRGDIDKTAYFIDASGTLRTTLGEILDRKDIENWKYLETGEPLHIRLPGKVLFMSGGAVLEGEWVNTGADQLDEILLDAPCYIIYEEN